MTGERMERRLAAVLAADVAGYSRLMGTDEEGTLAQLKAVRKALIDPTIAAHRGRIVKTTGDGMLVEFASAVDAARCAADIQRGMAEQNSNVPQEAKIEFRIGIHVGDIIIDDSDIFGDGVNIAARLEGIAEPGGICISDDAQRQIRGKVDIAFDDLGPRMLKNIVEPMRAWRCRLVPSSLTALSSVSQRVQPLALPDKPSIAVLPFQNMSGDPEQEYFADGITEEIITALSHLRTFPVTARNSSFTYKGQAVRPQRLAEELGVSYVLEGSVRKAAGRVRVTAQLIDARSGLHLWAERYDRSLDDVFGIQDEITLRIALALQPELAEAELRKGQLKRTDNLNAWDHYLRGISLLAQHTCSGNSEARAHFQQSIDLDATYGDAWAGVGWSHLRDYDLKCKDNLNESLELGFKAAQQGVKLAERSALTHYVLSTVYMWREQISLSLNELDRTLQLNPYFARAHLARGNRLDLAGRSIEGIAALRQALELNPRDPERHTYLSFLSRALLVHGSSEEALQFIEHAVVIASENPDMLYRLAACLAKLDRVEEARDALSRCEAMRPGFLALRRSWRPYNDDERNALFFAGMDRHGLRASCL